jgi:hypothetical protein
MSTSKKADIRRKSQQVYNGRLLNEYKFYLDTFVVQFVRASSSPVGGTARVRQTNDLLRVGPLTPRACYALRCVQLDVMPSAHATHSLLGHSSRLSVAQTADADAFEDRNPKAERYDEQQHPDADHNVYWDNSIDIAAVMAAHPPRPPRPGRGPGTKKGASTSRKNSTIKRKVAKGKVGKNKVGKVQKRQGQERPGQERPGQERQGQGQDQPRSGRPSDARPLQVAARATRPARRPGRLYCSLLRHARTALATASPARPPLARTARACAHGYRLSPQYRDAAATRCVAYLALSKSIADANKGCSYSARDYVRFSELYIRRDSTHAQYPVLAPVKRKKMVLDDSDLDDDDLEGRAAHPAQALRERVRRVGRELHRQWLLYLDRRRYRLSGRLLRRRVRPLALLDCLAMQNDVARERARLTA